MFITDIIKVLQDLPGSFFNFNYVENNINEVVFPNTGMAEVHSHEVLGHWALVSP